MGKQTGKAIVAAGEKSVRLLQISDLHLFSTPDEALLGVNTTASFQAVLTAIKQETFNADMVLCTGDLIQDHHIQGYHRFAQMTESLDSPIFWLEGNHDDLDIATYLSQYAHIFPEKQILFGEKWQILLLNSQVYQQPYGELTTTELQWLADKLAEYPERFCLVALHHNILPTNAAWLDQHSLKNSQTLAEVLNHFPQVKGILHGHIHQEVDEYWQGYRLLATPSTCIQFKPNCDTFTLDTSPQGWREIVLNEDGTIESHCKRLEKNEFLPNFNATGY